MYEQQVDSTIYGLTLDVLFVGSIIMQVLSLTIVCKLCTKRRGLNKQTLNTFTRHYLIYDLSFMPSNWTFIYMFVQENFMNNHHQIAYFSYIRYINYASIAIGSFFRICEPYLLRNLFPCCYRRRKSSRSSNVSSGRSSQAKGEKDKFSSDSLNAFLSSSANIDYVHQILAGISLIFESKAHLINPKKKRKFECDQFTVWLDREHNKRRIRVNYIVVSDLDDWDVAAASK